MQTSTDSLNEHEQRLLQAAVQHAKASPHAAMEIRRVPFGFETNLQEYGAGSITDPDAKRNCEVALKALLSRGLLRPVEAGGLRWTYAVTEQGFSALPE